MENRKKISRREVITSQIEDATINKLHLLVDNFSSKNNLNTEDVRFQFYTERSHYYGSDEEHHIQCELYAERLETDKEYNVRLLKEKSDRLEANRNKKSRKLEIEKNELLEYERLKLKYDKK